MITLECNSDSRCENINCVNPAPVYTILLEDGMEFYVCKTCASAIVYDGSAHEYVDDSTSIVHRVENRKSSIR